MWKNYFYLFIFLEGGGENTYSVSKSMFLILFFLVCVDNKGIFDRKTQNTSPYKFPHCCYNIFVFNMNTENPLDI